MSRIGKKPITIPKGVTIKVVDNFVEVQGPKGKMRQVFPSGINFELTDGTLVAKRSTDDPGLAKFHGLARTLVANAVTGVTEGYKRELDIVGVGYRAEVKGKQVVFALGYSKSPRGSTSRSTSRRTSRSSASIASWSGRSRRTSAASGSPIRTSRRASAIPVKC
jgi:ribosomal protein L6P/L9E